MEKDPKGGCILDCPYLVSLLFAVLLSLHLVTFLMFLLLVITSGNRTPGSRFYSDLLDTSLYPPARTQGCSSARLLAWL